MLLNVEKTKFQIFSAKRCIPRLNLLYKRLKLEMVDCSMYLQIEFDEQLMWGSLHNKEVGCTVALKIKCRYVKLWDWIQYQFKLVAM